MTQTPRGFNQPVKPSPALAGVIGPETRLRTQVTKDVWAYIKRNGLQGTEPGKRRMINADEALREVFGCDQLSMFTMTKRVAAHLSLDLAVPADQGA